MGVAFIERCLSLLILFIILYAISFSGEEDAIKVPVKKGKSITWKYYKE
jgi:hypothetical protein